jgi:hypothetical protein
MMTATTHITATCCAVSNQPGAAHTTTLNGHHPQMLRCSECDKEYSVDYNPSDELRIARFKERLLAAAKHAVDESHPLHPIYVDVHEV